MVKQYLYNISVIKMTTIRLANNFKKYEVLECYEYDILIHTEDLDVLKAHKLILVTESEWFHNFFITKEKKCDNNFNLFFFNVRSSCVKMALDLIYGKTVQLTKTELSRSSSFLSKLGLKWEEIHETDSSGVNSSVNPKNIQGSPPCTLYASKCEQMELSQANNKRKSGDVKDKETQESSKKVKHGEKSSIVQNVEPTLTKRTTSLLQVVELPTENNFKCDQVSADDPEKKLSMREPLLESDNKEEKVRKEEIFAILDQFTNDNSLDLDHIRHKKHIQLDTRNRGYVCISCAKFSKYFTQAEMHFEKHQYDESKESRDALRGIEIDRRQQEKLISSIKSKLKNLNKNKVLKSLTKVNTHLEHQKKLLEDIGKKQLPVFLAEKFTTLVSLMDSTISKISDLVLMTNNYDQSKK